VRFSLVYDLYDMTQTLRGTDQSQQSPQPYSVPTEVPFVQPLFRVTTSSTLPHSNSQGSIPRESSAIPSEKTEDLSGSGAGAGSEESVGGGKGEEEVAAGKEGKVEAVVPTLRKHKSRAANEIEDKRRKYGVDIPVINLDVDEGVEELKREAYGEGEKDDALAVEDAVRMLFWGEKPDKETTTRLLEKVMKVMKAEVVEIEEE